MGRIVVYGDIIDDIVVVPTGPIRVDTDTAATISHTAGGSAANTAAWLASLGSSVDFVGSVGASDEARLRQQLDAAGITPWLSAHSELPTGAIVLLIDGEARSMLTQRGANSALSPAAVTDDMLDRADILSISGYSVMDCADPIALRELFARAAARGVEVAVDPASAGAIADFGAARLLDALRGTSILFPNLDEGRAITGLENPLEIAAALGELFPVVALTLGNGGAIVVRDAASPEHIAAAPSRIVDPTGAGDAFAAGFLHEWTGTRDAAAAARAGAAVAALAVAAIGGRPGGGVPA